MYIYVLGTMYIHVLCTMYIYVILCTMYSAHGENTIYHINIIFLHVCFSCANLWSSSLITLWLSMHPSGHSWADRSSANLEPLCQSRLLRQPRLFHHNGSCNQRHQPPSPRALGVLQDQPKQKQQSVPREAGSTLELREDMGYANTGQLTYLLAVDIEINGPWFLHSLSLSLSLPLAFSMSSAELKAWFFYSYVIPENDGTCTHGTKTFSIPDGTHFLRSLQRQC